MLWKVNSIILINSRALLLTLWVDMLRVDSRLCLTTRIRVERNFSSKSGQLDSHTTLIFVWPRAWEMIKTPIKSGHTTHRAFLLVSVSFQPIISKNDYLEKRCSLINNFFYTQEKAHSGGTAVEVYTNVTLLSTLMSQRWQYATSV